MQAFFITDQDLSLNRIILIIDVIHAFSMSRFGGEFNMKISRLLIRLMLAAQDIGRDRYIFLASVTRMGNTGLQIFVFAQTRQFNQHRQV